MTKWNKSGGGVLADFEMLGQILKGELERPRAEDCLVVSEGEFKLLCSLDDHLEVYFKISSVFDGVIVDKSGRLV